MRRLQSLLSLVVSLLLAGTVWTSAGAQEKKAEPEKKSGAVVGVVTAKGVDWVEVKADGEQKARRYTPNWVGGAPKDGGGPDKEMVKVIKELKISSRVRLEWKFDERPRLVKVEVLKGTTDQSTPEKATTKKGTVAGVLTAKGDGWVEIKADGEEKARRYYPHGNSPPELRQAIRDTSLGSRVRIDWEFLERPRVLKLEVIKKAEKDQ